MYSALFGIELFWKKDGDVYKFKSTPEYLWVIPLQQAADSLQLFQQKLSVAFFIKVTDK